MNVTDEDGDTPLYTVETVETAQWLVSRGATIDIRNSEGTSVSPPLTPFSPGDPHSTISLCLIE